MAVTADQLRTQVAAGPSVTNETLQAVLDSAELVLAAYYDPTTSGVVVPPAAADHALLLTAAEMYHQDKAPNGVLNQQYAAGDGDLVSTPIRIGSDPLRMARAYLAPWLSAQYFCT